MPRCLMVFEPPEGGVPEHVLRLALGLPRHGWSVCVAGPARSIVHPQLAQAGVPTAKLPLVPGYGHPAQDARALRRLIGILARRRFDLVHVHSAKAGVLGRAAALMTRTPVVYTPNCFPFVGPWGLLRRQVATGVERVLGPSTDAIICVAEEERSLALRHRLTAPERLPLVYNGAQPCDGPLEPEPALKAFAAEGTLAACIAGLRPQKTVHVLVDAAPIVLERVPEARLAVIGNGEMRGELERRAARLGLGPRFRFFDFQPPASRQLSCTDVFVLPSAWEAFPISVLEAMACGVPQVATDVGGTAEAVADGETGLLCPPGDPAALADRLIALLRDPGRRAAMSAASRSRYARHFTIELMVERTAAVYGRVVSAAGG